MEVQYHAHKRKNKYFISAAIEERRNITHQTSHQSYWKGLLNVIKMKNSAIDY